MLELSMTAARHRKIPAVRVEQPNDLGDFHHRKVSSPCPERPRRNCEEETQTQHRQSRCKTACANVPPAVHVVGVPLRNPSGDLTNFLSIVHARQSRPLQAVELLAVGWF